MKRIFVSLFFAVMLCLAGFTQVSCDKVEEIYPGWWFYEVSGIRDKKSDTDFSQINDAFIDYSCRGASYADAEAEWTRFLKMIDDDKIVIDGDDSCKVTLYWDADYNNPGIETKLVGTKTWSNETEEQ